MMGSERKVYDQAFKQQAVELSFVIGNARKISDERGICPGLLDQRIREYQEYESNSIPGIGNPKKTYL